MAEFVFALLGLGVLVVLFVLFKKKLDELESPFQSFLPAPRTHGSPARSASRGKVPDDGDALAGLLLLIGAVWLGGKILEAGFAFLKEVDWDKVGGDLKKAIEQAAIEVEREPDVTARLDHAEQLIMSGGAINLDQAAMLTSATLELGLRQLAGRRRLRVAPENDSLAGLAIALGQAGYISSEDQSRIQYYAANIRNRVMHGQLGVLGSQDVRAFHTIARRCLVANGIA